jgi:hypothetical protein
MRVHSTSRSPRTDPFLLVTVETRRHVLAERARLRAAGELSTDSSVELPSADRQSAPTASASDWDDEPNIHDVRNLHEQLRANDAPIELPLRSRAVAYFIAAVLVAALVAVCVGMFVTGSARMF